MIDVKCHWKSIAFYIIQTCEHKFQLCPNFDTKWYSNYFASFCCWIVQELWIKIQDPNKIVHFFSLLFLKMLIKFVTVGTLFARMVGLQETKPLFCLAPFGLGNVEQRWRVLPSNSHEANNSDGCFFPSVVLKVSLSQTLNSLWRYTLRTTISFLSVKQTYVAYL